MPAEQHKLGSPEAADQLLRDLYITLRQKVRFWAGITNQTAQARMGYIGQHLVSIVTGFPGGKSGARGKDLILPDGEFAEIKTCSKVDQLGFCDNGDCGTAVSSIELSCSVCGSKKIQRNDDSKWLIGIRNDEEFAGMLVPKFYFMVLLEFVDIKSADGVVQASIWRVDPKLPGFALCMVDYNLNIRSKSISKAPFNMWPYQLKFDVMNGDLIYRSVIDADDKIKTIVSPHLRNEKRHVVQPLTVYSRSKNLTLEKLRDFCAMLKFPCNGMSKEEILKSLEAAIQAKKIRREDVADPLAVALYRSEVSPHLSKLPPALAKVVTPYLKRR